MKRKRSEGTAIALHCDSVNEQRSCKSLTKHIPIEECNRSATEWERFLLDLWTPILNCVEERIEIVFPNGLKQLAIGMRIASIERPMVRLDGDTQTYLATLLVSRHRVLRTAAQYLAQFSAAYFSKRARTFPEILATCSKFFEP